MSLNALRKFFLFWNFQRIEIVSKTDLNDAYAKAQNAMATLKSLVRLVIEAGPEEGLKNAEIGRLLGIYSGHVEHEGHISRTLLSMLEAEGVVEQVPETKLWKLRNHRVY